MTPAEAVELIRLVREHRKWDEQGEFYYVDADELEDAIIGRVKDEWVAADLGLSGLREADMGDGHGHAPEDCPDIGEVKAEIDDASLRAAHEQAARPLWGYRAEDMGTSWSREREPHCARCASRPRGGAA